MDALAGIRNIDNAVPRFIIIARDNLDDRLCASPLIALFVEVVRLADADNVESGARAVDQAKSRH